MWVLVLMAFVGGTGTSTAIESVPGFQSEQACKQALGVLIQRYNTTFSKVGAATGECVRQ